MSQARYTFPKSHHLRKGREFDAVYAAKCAKRVGPLRVHGKPNELDHARLGLSIGRRVGGAVIRNRLKRMLREAFRHPQHELPGAYDFVIVGYAHAPLEAEDYRRLLTDAAARIDREWRKRAQREADDV